MPYNAPMGSRAERLKKARIDAGFRTVTDAARALGITYSTYAGHENGSRQYDADDAVVYARKFKVPMEWLLTGRNGAMTPLRHTTLATVPIIGIVRAGTWQDVEEGDSGLYETVPAAPDAPPDLQKAYTVEGTSLDKIAQTGDILICLDYIGSGVEVNDGDLVIVERSRFNGQMVERTAKRVRRTLTGFELWPESNDPQYQEPIRINGADESDEIRIAAKVLWIMKKP